MVNKRKRVYSLMVNGQSVLTGTYAVVTGAYDAFVRWRHLSSGDFDVCIAFHYSDV